MRDDLPEIRPLRPQVRQKVRELIKAKILASEHGALRRDQVGGDREVETFTMPDTDQHTPSGKHCQALLASRTFPTRIDCEIDRSASMLPHTVVERLVREIDRGATQPSRELKSIGDEISDQDRHLISEQDA